MKYFLTLFLFSFSFSQINDTNVKAYYKFIDANLLTDYSSSGNDNALTSNGFSVDFADELVTSPSAGLQFDGSTEYLSIVEASSSDFEIGVEDFSIEVVFTTPASLVGGKIFAGKGINSASFMGWFFRLSGTNLQGEIYDGSGTVVYNSFATGITANTTYYGAMSVDRNGEVFIFIDGTKRAEATQSINNSIDINSTNDFKIGTRSNVNALWYDGIIHELRYSNVARTVTELSDSYDYYQANGTLLITNTVSGFNKFTKWSGFGKW